jgi:hypothetical protein
MAELPQPEWIPGAALPRFGRGSFRGFVAPHSTMVSDTRRIADPTPIEPPHGFVVAPVNPTNFSAGNRARHFVMGVAYEWWNWRHFMSGDIFVADPHQFHRVVNRRMARPRRLDKVVANRQVIYQAPQYGQDVGLPNFTRRRR